MSESRPPPDALLLLAPGCPHCPKVLTGLADLVKSGQIGRLHVINLANHPEEAQSRGVRSVPWTRIGDFHFSGLLSPKELADWSGLAGTSEGWRKYIGHLIETQQLSELETRLAKDTDLLAIMLPMLADKDTSLPMRLGLDAVLETIPPEKLAGHFDLLRTLIENPEPHIRIDGIHYLNSSGHPQAQTLIEARLMDEHKAVRDAAKSTLDDQDDPRNG